jgi:hypothetical protein
MVCGEVIRQGKSEFLETHHSSDISGEVFGLGWAFIVA